MFTYILIKNHECSSMLAVVTSKNLEELGIFTEAKSAILGANGNSNPNCTYCSPLEDFH